jgi:RNA polymerase sigma factor (sigma-70 family)
MSQYPRRVKVSASISGATVPCRLTASNVLTRIEACIPALRRYATALLCARDVADDLVHDCLVRALDTLDTRRDNADVRAWLFSVMHNLFISQLHRTKARAAHEPLDEMHAANASMYPDQKNSPRWRDLLRSLNRLPVEERTAVVLVSVGDLSYAEAASVLGIPIGTLMSHLSRGRAQSREIVNGKGVQTPTKGLK